MVTLADDESEDGWDGYTDEQIDLLKRAAVRVADAIQEKRRLERKRQHDQVSARLLQVAAELQRMGQDYGLPEINNFAKTLTYLALLSRLGDTEQ